MTAMKFQLVLCFLLGLYAFASSTSQYAVRFSAQSSGYPHAGRPEVFMNGRWGTICASDWDMNDAEVVCRELGKGYPNTITVSGGVTQAGSSVSTCLSRVNCYGHESRLRDCVDLTVSSKSGRSDKGIVCYPPPSDAGLRLRYGPDQYSGHVEVKLASGSWGRLYLPHWDLTRRQYVPNICRQLGYGELNWWDSAEHSSATGMTWVQDCAYGVAHHRGCTFGTVSRTHQAYVGCHKPGSIPCSAPFVPHHATIEDLRVNYNFGDRVNVTCDTSASNFTLQCHNKGLWSGPVVSCPEPDPPSLAYCSAPSVPGYSTIQNYRLTYKNGDLLNVTCDHGTSGDRPPWYILTCDDGIWKGQNIACRDPDIACNPPIIPAISSIEEMKARYKVGDDVNITCNDGSDWFVWQCQKDGMWGGRKVNCSLDFSNLGVKVDPSPRRPAPFVNKPSGTDFFVTGLLVTAVILFIMVLMCMSVFFIYVRSRSLDLTSSKENLQDEKGDRGPLPDVPDGYANYIVGDQALYVEPYLKPRADDLQSYETIEKPM